MAVCMNASVSCSVLYRFTRIRALRIAISSTLLMALATHFSGQPSLRYCPIFKISALGATVHPALNYSSLWLCYISFCMEFSYLEGCVAHTVSEHFSTTISSKCLSTFLSPCHSSYLMQISPNQGLS